MDFSDSIAAAVKTAAQRAESLEDIMKQFMFVIPQARAPPPTAWCSHPNQSVVLEAARQAQHAQREWVRSSASLRTAIVRRQLFFPDRRLLQFDCGKLQVRCSQDLPPARCACLLPLAAADTAAGSVTSAVSLMSVCPSGCPSVRPSVCLSVCLSVSLHPVVPQSPSLVCLCLPEAQDLCLLSQENA